MISRKGILAALGKVPVENSAGGFGHVARAVSLGRQKEPEVGPQGNHPDNLALGFDQPVVPVLSLE